MVRGFSYPFATQWLSAQWVETNSLSPMYGPKCGFICVLGSGNHQKGSFWVWYPIIVFNLNIITKAKWTDDSVVVQWFSKTRRETLGWAFLYVSQGVSDAKGHLMGRHAKIDNSGNPPPWRAPRDKILPRFAKFRKKLSTMLLGARHGDGFQLIWLEKFNGPPDSSQRIQVPIKDFNKWKL